MFGVRPVTPKRAASGLSSTRASGHASGSGRFGLKISDHHPEEHDPESWAGYIHDEVMEAIDGTPGLPESGGPITWVEL